MAETPPSSKRTRNLAPGGYVEIQELDGSVISDDGTLKDHHGLTKWSNLLHQAAVSSGRPFVAVDKFKDILAEVGFTDLVETRYKWPTNRWPKDKKHKELGTWHNENSSRALESAIMAPLTRALGWTKEEVHVFVATVRKDLNNPGIHAYTPVYASLCYTFCLSANQSQCFGLWKEARGMRKRGCASA